MTKKINSPNIDNNLKTNLDRIKTKAISKAIIKYSLNLCVGLSSFLLDNSGKKRAKVTIMIIAISPMPRSMSIT
jgi:hypothetical protein